MRAAGEERGQNGAVYLVGRVDVCGAVGEEVGEGEMVGVGVIGLWGEQVGHELAPVHLDELFPHGCLLLFQLDAAVESGDVDERVGGSESFPCAVPILRLSVVIQVCILIHIGLIRKPE